MRKREKKSHQKKISKYNCESHNLDLETEYTKQDSAYVHIYSQHTTVLAQTHFIYTRGKKIGNREGKKGGAARMAKPKVKITKRSSRKTRNLSDEWARTKVKLNSEQEPVQANISSIWSVLSSSLLFSKFTITDFYDVRYHLQSYEQKNVDSKRYSLIYAYALV